MGAFPDGGRIATTIHRRARRSRAGKQLTGSAAPLIVSDVATRPSTSTTITSTTSMTG